MFTDNTFCFPTEISNLAGYSWSDLMQKKKSAMTSDIRFFFLHLTFNQNHDKSPNKVLLLPKPIHRQDSGHAPGFWRYSPALCLHAINPNNSPETPARYINVVFELLREMFPLNMISK